jgi:hypothetical protein
MYIATIFSTFNFVNIIQNIVYLNDRPHFHNFIKFQKTNIMKKFTLLLFLMVSFTFYSIALTINANPTANNGSGGIFFQLTTNAAGVQVTSFNTIYSSSAGSSVTVAIYMRSGPYSGFTGSNAGWTFLGNVVTTSAGSATVAPMDVTSLNINLSPSTTTSFYLHAITTGGGIRYYGTGSSSNTTFSDANLTLFTDISRTGTVPFGGTQFTPRALSGSIDYNLAGPCGNITEITCGTEVTYNNSGFGDWTNYSCGWYTPGKEKIYSFTPLVNGTYTLEVTNTNYYYIDYSFKVASGGCSNSGWTCIQDIVFPGQYTFGPLTAGTTYYILLDPESTSTSNHSFKINCLCTPPNPSVTIAPNPVCAGQLAWFTATGGAEYSWSGPNGFTFDGPQFGRHMQPNMAGVYTVTVTSSDGCTATKSVTASVTGAPNATISISPNPACSGGLVQLSSSGGNSYAWSGPNGFASTQQNPQIPDVKTYHSGTYTVTVTNAAECTAVASADLKVNETPVGKAWYDETTACTGSTLHLYASGGGTYQWSGPGGFSSTLQNPTRANVNSSHSGIYTVTVTGLFGGCTSTFAVNVQIRPLPTITAWTTTPQVCEGDVAYLFASGGVSYDWTGPYGYHSNFQNPIINSIPAYLEGVYKVTGTNEYGCSSSASVFIDVQTVNAIVNATPNPVPYGGTLYLTASGGQYYQWTGPNGFYSYFQNPIIYKFTQVNAGLYSCVVTTDAGCQDTEILLIQVKNQNGQDEPQLETRSGKYVQLFPNPTSQYLLIESDYTGEMNYTILGMDGNISGSGTTQNNQKINVQQLIPGTYFIQWTYTNGGKTNSFISKFVKTN